MKKKTLFCIVNYIVLALALSTAAYIMVNGMGLIESMDFGAGAYYYADIPEFAKYTDGSWYTSPVHMWAVVAVYLIWSAFMYKMWGWMDRKGKKQ